MSTFKYDKKQGRAEATLYSMFKFPESNRVHFQCDILVCKGMLIFFNNSKYLIKRVVRLAANKSIDALFMYFYVTKI